MFANSPSCGWEEGGVNFLKKIARNWMKCPDLSQSSTQGGWNEGLGIKFPLFPVRSWIKFPDMHRKVMIPNPPSPWGVCLCSKKIFFCTDLHEISRSTWKSQVCQLPCAWGWVRGGSWITKNVFFLLGNEWNVQICTEVLFANPWPQPWSRVRD